MKTTRRRFMKDAAKAGAIAAAGSQLIPEVAAHAEDAALDGRCPYFDQALVCGGPDENGKLPCE